MSRFVASSTIRLHKAWKPRLNGMQRFRDFVAQEREGDKFICHCYDESDVGGGEKPQLFDVLREGVPTTVLIGPEGDFSVEEVKFALQNGYRSVTLGRSRLRTETAALAAVHMMQLKNM